MRDRSLYPRRSRIMLLCNSLNGGGAERMMVYIANGLADKGFEVDLVVLRLQGPYVSLVSPSVNLIELKYNRARKNLLRLRGVIDSRKPLALISTQDHISELACLAKIVTKHDFKLIVREASVPSLRRAKGFAGILRDAVFKRADHYVAVSSYVREDLSNYLGIEKSRITVVYNPVYHESIPGLALQPVSHRFFVEGNDIIVGMGRISREKDFGTLIMAFQKVYAQRPSARLLILGDCPATCQEKEKLIGLIEDNGLSEVADLAGFVLNPFSFLSKANVFVLTSLYEGLPGSLIQAMASGCPVVSTDAPGGVSEILDGGKLGPILPVGNCTAIAGAILAVLDEEVNRSDLIARAEDFGLEKAIEGYLRVLQS